MADSPSSLVAFRASVRSALPPSAAHPNDADALAELLVQEMARRWAQGESPVAEEYLARHPQLFDHPEAAMQLVCEEICQREEHGQEVTSDEYLRRFPQWKTQLEVVLDCQRLFRPSTTQPDFPAIGQSLGDARLLAELGRGAAGRVFLAMQGDLSDRPVVLKVTPCEGEEHLSLARLQHTHVVPLYTAYDDPHRHLRVICMPYFGGATLDTVIDSLAKIPPAQRTGRDLLMELDRAQTGSLVPLPIRGWARQFLAAASYVQAVCWIGACLADALQYAHERDLLHLDLKPSNVLLAADGQPMLLDFHLARGPMRPGGPEPEWFGGTPDFMSPEQQQVADAVTEGKPIPVPVDGRSDVFSLGLSLYEALGGAVPAPTEPVADLRRRNPRVSIGLADILARCLQCDPAKRYPTAGALAADLRYHLNDKPLQGVANRSPAERWRKWRARSPHAVRRVLLGLTLLTGLGAGITAAWRQYDRRAIEAQSLLAEGQHRIQQHEYGEAARTLQRGREAAQELPGHADLVAAFDGQLERVRRAQRLRDLHALAEQIRLLSVAEALTPQTMRSLDTACRAIWDVRIDVVRHAAEHSNAPVSADLLDVAIIAADMRNRLALTEPSKAATQESLRILDEAENLFGASAILYRERQRHAEVLGDTALARAAAASAARMAPRTAWEHGAVGRAALRAGNLAEARAAFDRAVQLEPQGFWPNFYQGTCAHRLQKYADAVSAFRVCIALAPERAECHYNRALAYQAMTELDRALADFDRAIQLQPMLSGAWLNRGLLHFQAGRLTDAIADFQQALAHGADPATAHYNLAVAYQARTDLPQALAHARQALQHNPAHREARQLSDHLQRGP
ncbi:MAG: tetratricopeptide repeat protein [Gemmataceae bacterium]|nr:tetratricopeptide repeat protein [Gemmataceae bacterium]